MKYIYLLYITNDHDLVGIYDSKEKAIEAAAGFLTNWFGDSFDDEEKDLMWEDFHEYELPFLPDILYVERQPINAIFEEFQKEYERGY